MFSLCEARAYCSSEREGAIGATERKEGKGEAVGIWREEDRINPTTTDIQSMHICKYTQKINQSQKKEYMLLRQKHENL